MYVFLNNFAFSSYLYLCSFFYASFFLCYFLLFLNHTIYIHVVVNSKTSNRPITSNKKHKLFSIVTFFLSLNFSPITFIFLLVYHLLINAWSSKSIWPIITSLCVPCTTTWKHFASLLWMNVINFIFQLLHIHNLLTLVVLTPPCSPCTPFVDCAHLSANYDNAYADCIDFST